jgi:hypothetical protein
MAGENPWRRERAWIVAVVLVAAASATGYLAWRRYARPMDRRYQLVIRALADDPAANKADGRGRVGLSGGNVGLTPRNELFVSRRDDGSFVALFPTYYGNGAQLEALMYTSRPLRDGDTYLRQPTLGVVQHAIDIGNYRHVIIDDRIDDHWFHASYGMH